MAEEIPKLDDLKINDESQPDSVQVNPAQGEEEEEYYNSIEEYFIDCCRANDIDEAKDCIAQGCDITWFNNTLANGLHMACANNHVQILQLLKEELDKWGPEQNEKKTKFINHKNSDSNTPLHWAAVNNHKEAIEYMITSLKADANIVNAMNKTPFDEAVLIGHKEAAEILAKVTSEDMSIYEGLDDYVADGEEEKKEETMSDS